MPETAEMFVLKESVFARIMWPSEQLKTLAFSMAANQV